MKRKLLLCAAVLFSVASVNAVILTEDFESTEWAAVADPAPGGFIAVAGLPFPNGWQYHYQVADFVDNLILSEGGTYDGTLSTLTTTSMGLKNWSALYIEIPNVQELAVTFDYESAFPQGSNQNVVVGVWEGTTADPATDNLDSQEIDFSTALSGTFDATFDLSGATGGTLNFFMYKKNWNQAVHVDNITLSEIPEPATISLLGIGMMLLRKKK